MYFQARVTAALTFFFKLPSSTGVIYTAGILDCETKDSYWLTVYATDRGITPLSASTEVFIQVRYDPNFERNALVHRPVSVQTCTLPEWLVLRMGQSINLHQGYTSMTFNTFRYTFLNYR